MERCTFNLAKHEEQKTVADFVARIRKLSMHCNFKDILNDMLRDKLVCGLRDKDTRIKLFEEKNLKFETALEIATAHEIAVKNATVSKNTLEQKSTKSDVYKLQ